MTTVMQHIKEDDPLGAKEGFISGYPPIQDFFSALPYDKNNSAQVELGKKFEAAMKNGMLPDFSFAETLKNALTNNQQLQNEVVRLSSERADKLLAKLQPIDIKSNLSGAEQAIKELYDQEYPVAGIAAQTPVSGAPAKVAPSLPAKAPVTTAAKTRPDKTKASTATDTTPIEGTTSTTATAPVTATAVQTQQTNAPQQSESGAGGLTNLIGLLAQVFEALSSLGSIPGMGWAKELSEKAKKWVGDLFSNKEFMTAASKAMDKASKEDTAVAQAAADAKAKAAANVSASTTPAAGAQASPSAAAPTQAASPASPLVPAGPSGKGVNGNPAVLRTVSQSQAPAGQVSANGTPNNNLVTIPKPDPATVPAATVLAANNVGQKPPPSLRAQAAAAP